MSLHSIPLGFDHRHRRSPITHRGGRLPRDAPGRLDDRPDRRRSRDRLRGRRVSVRTPTCWPASRRSTATTAGCRSRSVGRPALQRFTADPPTELPLRNSLQLPVTPESMARLGCALHHARQGTRPAGVHPRLGRPARRGCQRRRLGEPGVDRRCDRLADRDRRRRADDAADLLRTDDRSVRRRRHRRRAHRRI